MRMRRRTDVAGTIFSPFPRLISFLDRLGLGKYFHPRWLPIRRWFPSLGINSFRTLLRWEIVERRVTSHRRQLVNVFSVPDKFPPFGNFNNERTKDRTSGDLFARQNENSCQPYTGCSFAIASSPTRKLSH